MGVFKAGQLNLARRFTTDDTDDTDFKKRIESREGR